MLAEFGMREQIVHDKAGDGRQDHQYRTPNSRLLPMALYQSLLTATIMPPANKRRTDLSYDWRAVGEQVIRALDGATQVWRGDQSVPTICRAFDLFATTNIPELELPFH